MRKPSGLFRKLIILNTQMNNLLLEIFGNPCKNDFRKSVRPEKPPAL